MKYNDNDLVVSTPPIGGVVFWPAGQKACAPFHVREAAGHVLIEINGVEMAVYFTYGRLFDWRDTVPLNLVSAGIAATAIAKMMNLVIGAFPSTVKTVVFNGEDTSPYYFVDADDENVPVDEFGQISVGINYEQKE